MPRGDKSTYTEKQKRQAEHIAEGYREEGLSAAEAKRRAWATVNDQDGGGRKSGAGRGKARKTSVKDPGRGPTARRASTAKKAAPKRKTAKKAAKKSATTRTSATRKRPASKAAARKRTVRKSAPKRGAAKRATPKRKTAKRAPAKRSTAR